MTRIIDFENLVEYALTGNICKPKKKKTVKLTSTNGIDETIAEKVDKKYHGDS